MRTTSVHIRGSSHNKGAGTTNNKPRQTSDPTSSLSLLSHPSPPSHQRPPGGSSASSSISTHHHHQPNNASSSSSHHSPYALPTRPGGGTSSSPSGAAKPSATNLGAVTGDDFLDSHFNNRQQNGDGSEPTPPPLPSSTTGEHLPPPRYTNRRISSTGASPPGPPPIPSTGIVATFIKDGGISGGGVFPPPPSSSSSLPRGGTLEHQLHLAKVEVERRTDEVNAIQRNFERLSEMYMKDKEAVKALQVDNMEYQRELESLRAEKKVFVAVRAEFVKLKQIQEEMSSDNRASTNNHKSREVELETTVHSLQEREKLLEERLERSHSKLVDLQRKVFTQFAPRLRDVGLTSASIVEKLEGVVDVSGVMGMMDDEEGGGGTGLSTGETLRSIMRRNEASTTSTTPLLPDNYSNIYDGSSSGLQRELSPTSAMAMMVPLTLAIGATLSTSNNHPHLSVSPANNSYGNPSIASTSAISLGLNHTFAVLAPEYALGSEAEEDGSLMGASGGSKSTSAVRASHPTIAPLDPVRLSKKSTDSLVSPPRHSRRLKLLSTQFDTLFGALDMCEKELLPCVVQFTRTSTHAHKSFKREVSSLTARIDSLDGLNAALTTTKSKLESELSTLQQRYDKDQSIASEEIASLKKELDNARNSNDITKSTITEVYDRLVLELKRELREAATDGAEKGEKVVHLESKLQSLQSKINSLQGELISAAEVRHRREMVEKDQEVNNNKEKEENKRLRSQVEEAARQHKHITSREKALIESNNKLTDEIRTLKEELSIEVKLRTKVETSLLECSTKLDAVMKECADSRSQLADVTVKMEASVRREEALLAQVALLEQAANEDEDANGAELATARKQNAELQVAASTSSNQCERLTEQLSTLKKQLEKMKSENASTNGDHQQTLTNLRTQHDREVATLRTQLAAATNQLNEMEVECAQLQLEREAHGKEIAMLEKAVTQGNQEVSQLQASTEIMKKRHEALEVAEARVGRVRVEASKFIESLQSIEDACESGYSCQACMEVLTDPLTCAPCGHCFCRKCLEDANKKHMSPASRTTLYCPECEIPHITYAIPSRQLDLLASKFEFRKKVLAGLEGLIQKW